MILLLGGTGETAAIATLLAEAGFNVYVSTATDNALYVGNHSRITRRIGKLDVNGISAIVTEKGISAIVDATHPFAEAASAAAKEAAEAVCVPYIAFVRPRSDYDYERIIYVKDHDEAAERAFSFDKPVLLMTGSRNLAQYAAVAKNKNLELYARVLPHAESAAACRDAGLDEKYVITGRGPFSTRTNVELIKKYGIGVIVSKDSGKEGGVIEKVESARLCGIHVVMIERPQAPSENAYNSAREIVDAVNKVLA
ncbi:MAG: precorrin-6A reductase [Nitrospinota bacterium]